MMRGSTADIKKGDSTNITSYMLHMLNVTYMCVLSSLTPPLREIYHFRNIHIAIRVKQYRLS